jgi:hypothetical protein
MSETFEDRFSRLTREGNFLGAGMMLKHRTLSEEDEAERAGELAGAIVEELSSLDRRQDKERILYLRSILAWLFRDIPGLSSLYREQLQAAEGAPTGPMSDLYRNLRNFADVASGRKKFSEGAEETAENMRRNFEQATENLSSGNEGFEQFVQAAEEGFKGGFAQFGELLKQFAEPSSGPTMRKAEPEGPTHGGFKERPSSQSKATGRPVDIETEE